MSPPGTIIRSGPGLVSVLGRLAGLDRVAVTVGLQGSRATTAAGPAEPSELVVIGAAHEYGTDTIPMRPWLRTSARRYGKEWGAAWAGAVRAALRGDTADTELRLVGLGMQGDVQATVLDGPWFPLSPETTRRKGSDVPLVDSGQMRQSIRAQVERPGARPVVVG